jgi:hypothetical protein
MSCGGCEERDSYDKNSFLDKPYEFIAGILTPDSLRESRVTIFVGRIIPNSEAPFPNLGPDTTLNRLLLTTRGLYFAEIVGHADAKVVIISPQGESTELLHTGNGYYEDINDNINVMAGQQYTLNVERDGQSYSSETRVPGDFDFIGLSEGDTVEAQWRFFPFSGVYAHGAILRWQLTQDIHSYRVDIWKSIPDSNYSIQALYHTYGDTIISSYGYKVPYHNHLTLSALDTSYAKLYVPDSDFTASDEWLAWYESRNRIPDILQPSERTNIVGKNVAGIFGSQNIRIVNFVTVPVN